MFAVHPKRLPIMSLSSTTTSVQHPLEWCNGCHRTTAPVRSPHTSYRWRVREPIKWMGIIRRPWLTRASGENLARTPGLHSYSLREVPWDFYWPQRVRTSVGLKEHSTFLKIGSFYISSRVKQLSFTLFESIQPISGSGGSNFSLA